MGTVRGLITGAAIGGTIIYLTDPEEGRRRRALVRDQIVKAGHKLTGGVEAGSRDTANRARGLFGEARYQWQGGTPDDAVLQERVRARMGHYVSHPSSIFVTVRQGKVTLSGPILRDEAERLMEAASSVPGVKEIDSRLEEYEAPADIPGLQGMPGRRAGGARADFMQRRWAPATRMFAAGLGGALVITAMRMRNILVIPSALLGTGLLTRAITNRDFGRLFGLRGGRAAITLHKTINIDAPLERVYEIWSNYEHFPYFMSHVRDVREMRSGRSHWTVSGPLGVSVEWDAEITKKEPSRVLAWKTIPGSTVDHAGVIHFDPNPDGYTRVDVQLSYNPIIGALGHVLATVFHADPKKQMDDDLMRMKSFIETGQLPHDAAAGRMRAPEGNVMRERERVGAGWRGAGSLSEAEQASGLEAEMVGEVQYEEFFDTPASDYPEEEPLDFPEDTI